MVWLQTSLSDEDQYVFTSFLPVLQFTSLVIQFEHVYKDVWLLQHCAARSGGNVFCLPPFMSPRRSLVIRLNVISDQVKLNCIKTTFCKSNKRKADFLQVPVYLHTSLQKSHLIGCPKPAFVKKERFIVIKCQNCGSWLICTCPLDVNNNNSTQTGAIVDGSETGKRASYASTMRAEKGNSSHTWSHNIFPIGIINYTFRTFTLPRGIKHWLYKNAQIMYDMAV